VVACFNGINNDGANHFIIGLAVHVSQHEFSCGMIGLLNNVLDNVLHGFYLLLFSFFVS
jgi:hypothetical protein